MSRPTCARWWPPAERPITLAACTYKDGRPISPRRGMGAAKSFSR